MSQLTFRKPGALFSAIALGVTVSLIGPLLVASPAVAVPRAAVPADPTAWTATPYSPLAWSDVDAADNTAALTFDAEAGGLPDAADIGTGFTSVQPSSAAATAPWFVPENITVAGGRLNVKTTAGIANTTVNTQDNALGLGYDTNDGQKIALRTTLAGFPTNAQGFAQGGIWFGPNDANYVKIAVIANSTTNRQVQLYKEIADATVAPTGTFPPGALQTSAFQIIAPTHATASLATAPIKLELILDSAAGTVSGTYQVGTAAPVALGTLSGLPAAFFDGSTVNEPADSTVTNFGGIYTTNRNMTAGQGAPITLGFEDFSSAQLDTTPPAAPSAVTAIPSDDTIGVSWPAVADADVAGYRVYRSTTATVDTTAAATPISGPAPVTTTSLTDDTVFRGGNYTYAVVAVDTSGNVSGATSSGVSSTTGPTGTRVKAYDFTTPTGPVGDGYTRDAGAPYTAAAGFGWKGSDGVPVDISSLTRVRGVAGLDPRLDTLVHMRPNTPGTTGGLDKVPYSFHVDVPDGVYSVLVAVGDGNPGANGFDSAHLIRAEETTVVGPFTPNASRLFDEAVLADVVVDDGELTIDQVGGTNTKINYVEIYQQSVVAPAAPTGLTGTLAGKDVALAWTAVDGAASYRVFRGTGETVPTDGTPLATVSTTRYADLATQFDTTYRYVVVAVNTQGVASAPSAPVTVVIPAEDDPEVPPVCTASQWTAQWFDNRALTGTPAAITCADVIDQSYPAGTKPDIEAIADHTDYSIRWTKTIDQGAGSYAIKTRSDDGIRVFIDGQRVVNRWFAQDGTTTNTQTVALAAGEHTVVVEYYQSLGAARATASIQKAASSCSTSEWRAEYFNGTELAGSVLGTACTSAIDQSFTPGQAPAGLADEIGSDLYSIRWTRTINEGRGTYTFTARSDDGIRIFVDGESVLDEWYDQDATETHTAEATLTSGPHLVTVEYYQGYNGASAEVGVERTSFDSVAPDAPTGVSALPATSSIGLTWAASASTDVAGYRVYRSETTPVAITGTPISESALVTNRSFVDTTATPDTTYYYSVVAVDTSDNVSAGSTSVIGRITTAPDTEAPAAPGAVAATALDNRVDLTWTASASADTAGYRVYRSLEPHVAAVPANLVSGQPLVAGTAFSDATAANGTTYFYVVVAIDLARNVSAVSNEVVAVPLVPNTTNVKVDFTATNGAPAAGYLADWGQAYGVRAGATQGAGTLSYGWIGGDGFPVSLVGNGRDRGRTGVPELLDSILHVQYGDVDGGNGTNGVKVDGTWELAVPDGLYDVTVGVGDQMGATAYDSDHVINVEGSIGIESFVGTAAAEYKTVTTRVGVWDGKLTVDATDGFNTKIGFIEVKGLARQPHVDTVLPENRVVGHDVNAGVSATIKVPYAGIGVAPLSLPGNVKLFNAATGVEVPTTVGTSGGNDVISLAPNAPLAANTEYRFVVTSGVTDGRGVAFVPFSSLFTTGSGETSTPGAFTPITGVGFEKIELPTARGKYWSSFAFGPDGKLYATSIGQGIWRFPVNADGTLGTGENLGYEGVAHIGLLFDKSATASNLKLWVTRTSANFSEQGEWVSTIHLLSGPALAADRTIFEGLPRALSDHLTNSMAYGPDGRIYFQQGSNQAAGDLDNSWGQRGEQLLTAATLVFDPANGQVQTAASGGASINVKTAAGGTYNPYAQNAPLKIYATGIRNAYDLVWHSNGHLYVPTNGTAGGANTPGVTANANGTFTRTAAPGIPGFSTVNNTDSTAECVARGYTGGTVPPQGNIGTQRDLLFDVVQGGYYGHPNPERCEWVLNAGGGADPAFPLLPPTKYPASQKPDPNYRGIAYDFEFNKSPNGAIEYKSPTFGGQLKGRLLVVRFSNNNDILFLQPDTASGKILGAQTSVGITGVANSTIGGVDGFNDPLEIVEDPANGNLYVNQYDRSGSDQRMYLLRVPTSQQASVITPSASELIFSATRSNSPNGQIASQTRTFTVTNNRSEAVSLTSALSGANAGEFVITGGTATIPAKGSVTLSAVFRPGTTAGQRSASLQLTAGSATVSVGLYGLALAGIEGGNEPALNDVLGTLGHRINVGWTNLEGGMQRSAKGDEVLEPLFVKSGTAPVSITPLAHFAPAENLPFGWYTGDGAADERRQVGAINGNTGAGNGYQSLLPPVTAGSGSTFDPGTSQFGLFYVSAKFNRIGYTEDRLNDSNGAHRARIYPAKNRAGVLIPNAYIVGFEDASNGDYQDYLFLVKGLRPVADTGSVDGAIKIDFTSPTGDVAAGYLRDFGQAYGARTGAGQGSGLSYGWKDQTTENDVDLSVGGTTNSGNGRDRGTTQPDVRLDSFMHMQPSKLVGFNGTPTDAYWQLALPNGQYDVTIGVGDPAPQNQAEIAQINVEEQAFIPLFTPTGVAGSSTRHSVVTKTVTVADGFLTVDALGGTNTKISFIDVVPHGVVNPPVGDPSEGAQVKIDFQPAEAPTATGWTADTGAAFSASRGFGWTSTTGVPLDRSGETRYRNAPAAGIAYPTDDVRLQTYAFMSSPPTSTIPPALWEYSVPNGTYEVGVAVGDANYLDSVHSVTAEGQPVINSFAPTATTPFQVGKRTVEVADGKLTIAGPGENTKIAWLSIKGEGLGQPVPPTPVVKVSFRPGSSTPPAGFVADNGAAYQAARGYGWLVAGTPTDRSNATRLRETPTAGIAFPTNDASRQGLILTQAGSVTGITDGVWEYALANGVYAVQVSVGDAGFTDSVHGVRAENTPVVTAYTPTGAAPFTTGTAQVTVTDGKLTLTPTGTNTKINWVSISGATLLAPSLEISANGEAVDTAFTGGATRVEVAAAASKGSTIASLTYRIGTGPTVAYTAPFTLSEVGTRDVVFTATDAEGRVTTRTVAFTIENIGGTVSLRNEQATRVGGAIQPGFSENVLVMQRINAGVTTHKTIDTATVTVTNTGTKDLKVTSLKLSGSAAAQFELVTPPATPLLIAPGASQAITVKFIAASGSRGVRVASLDIATSDPLAPVTKVALRGGYMTFPEGGSELTLPEISTLFGWSTNIGDLQNGDEMRTSALDGDEVRAYQWKRMDSTKPVTARQLGAFHGCCTQTETINVSGQSATQSGPYGQSILPLTASNAPVVVNANPTGNFTFTVSGQTTNNASYMALKTWPVINAAGAPVPGAWIVGHDYIGSPNQCGIAPTNCDFQDNVYLITNMLPATNVSDTTAPAAPTAPAATVDGTEVDVTWTKSVGTDVAGYHVERATVADGPWTRLTGGTPLTVTSFTDTAVPLTDAAFYRVVAVDTSGNVSAASTTAQVDLTPIPNRALRFRAGATTLVTGGNTWLPDAPYAAGGSLYTNPQVTQIAGTTDDALYFTERSDVPSFGYNVPLPSGLFEVKLHYAEIYWGAPGGGPGGNGKRVFNVNFEGGANEHTGIDLIARAGTTTAYSTTNQVAVTDGNLDIDFAATVNFPAIQAVEIRRLGDAPVAPAPAASLTGAVSGSSVVLNWTASGGPGLAGYTVERATAAAGPYTAISGTAPVTGTTFTDTAVPIAANAYYRVVAVGTSGLVSAPTNVATVAVGSLYVPTGLTATVGTTSVALGWTAPAGKGITGYTVEVATSTNGPWTSLTGATPVTGTSYTDTTPPVAATAYYRVIANGAQGAAGAPTAPVTANLSGLQRDIRINTGGPAVTVGGVRWAADSNFTGGKTYRNSAVTQIAGTTADELYLDERSATTNLGGFGYDFPLTSGTYTVRLHFAELYHGAPGGGAGGTGKRVFSANLEGGSVEVPNLDLNAKAGTATAYITTNVLNVTDGNLDIDFTATVDEPSIAAIEIIRGGTVPVPAPSVPTGVTGAISGTSNVVSWTAAANATGYHVERATTAAGPWTRLTGTTPITALTYTDTAGSTLPTALYRVVATGASGATSAASATVTVTRPTTPAQQPVRINAGGGAVTVDGVAFAADSLFSGGKSYSNTAVTQIAGTTADPLYVNERSATANLGGFGYDVPLANGSYTVILHFAELFHGAPGGGAGGAGKRVFSVNLEGGTPEVANLDLNALVAPTTAYTQTRQIQVTDGNLDVDFTASVDQPTIGAIEILPGTVSGPAPVPTVPTGVTAAASGTANQVSWTASTGASGYHVERATSATGTWTRLTGTTAVTGTTYSDAAGSTLPTALYRVVAQNAAGAVTAPSATATVTRTPAQQPVRINSGGGAVTVGGVAWGADAFFSGGGKAYSNPAVTQIAGTTADALYFSERSTVQDKGSFSYDIPVANGTYTVILHHAEIYHGATGGGPGGTGKRVFDVNLEGGTTEIVGRDIVALAPGSMTAYRSSNTVTVTGGNLDIDFTGTVDQPSVAAIEVIPGAGQPSALAGGGVPPVATAPPGGAGTGATPALAAARSTSFTSDPGFAGVLLLLVLLGSAVAARRLGLFARLTAAVKGTIRVRGQGLA